MVGLTKSKTAATHPSDGRPRKHAVVALVGNPNTGKTTLFNSLTGYRQRVGNYPGVTVEKKTGFIRGKDDASMTKVIDLPGAYSLAAHSADEAVVLDVLLGKQDRAATPDLIVVVVDSTQLARSLFFVSQILEIGRPVVVALNMVDLAESLGLKIDSEALARELGVPVVAVVATKQIGIGSLIERIVDTIGEPPSPISLPFPQSVGTELDGLADSLEQAQSCSDHHPMRIELLETLLDPGGFHEVRLTQRYGHGLADELAQRRARIVAAGESIVEVEARVRYAWVDGVLDGTLTRVRPARRLRSETVDRVLTNRVVGLAILTLLMGACFQSVYAWATPLMDAIDGALGAVCVAVEALVPAGAIQSLLINGVVAGVGAVVAFLPQILILFLFLAILEDCGYMARAAFLLDRWMGMVGLNGKSFIPLMSSFACAVPGIMATRTIENRDDRLATILIAPLMSCSARLPVYVLLISAFVPATPLLGGLIGLQAVVLSAMYTIGIIVAVCVAFVAKRTVLKGAPQSFLMELPGYKWPSPRTVVYRMYEQGRVFCVTAGTIIFAVTIVVWTLGYYPRPGSIAAEHESMRIAAGDAHETRLQSIAKSLDPSLDADGLAEYGPVAAVLGEIEAVERRFTVEVAHRQPGEGSPVWHAARRKADVEIATIVLSAGPAGEAAHALYASDVELEDRLSEIDRAEAGTHLQHSVLGRMGRRIEPLVRPLGWDWRIGTAVIASFPAREVVIATMGTIYNLGKEQDETSASLREKLHKATWPDGRPVFDLAVALSIMVFFALCCQCGATLATIKRETNSWRWPVITFSYMTALAYLGALVTYQIASRLV